MSDEQEYMCPKCGWEGPIPDGKVGCQECGERNIAVVIIDEVTGEKLYFGARDE